MNISTTLTTHLLLIANAAMLAAAAIAIIRFRQQARRFEKFWESPVGAAMAETEALKAQSESAPDPELSKKVSELQSIVWTLARKEPATDNATAKRLPIENAVRMAKHGASIGELIRSCGLTIGEAQLMRKLHGKNSARTVN
ncbi:MAG: DUF2802 domain-containing protein [Woeseiaceae bacterium]|nr:DUF2802 domain-containing protein [Woeseiaceae bacterium]